MSKTQGKRMEPARVAVLETCEILEYILAQLPCRDLLRMKRVCHQWQALIARSSSLRRNLFLEPIVCEANIKGMQLPSTIYRRILPNDFLHHFGVINPLLQIDCASTLNIAPFFDLSGKLMRQMLSISGPWDDMLMVQPPVKTIRLDFEEGGHKKESLLINDAEGIRVGQFSRRFRELLLQRGYRIDGEGDVLYGQGICRLQCPVRFNRTVKKPILRFRLCVHDTNIIKTRP